MNPDQRFGVKRLLDIFAYLANDHALAKESWNQFIKQLEVAAIISGTVGGQEHADWFVYGLGLWSSTQWPVYLPFSPLKSTHSSGIGYISSPTSQ